MSLSGTTNTYLPPTLDGLNIIEADAIYINGIPIDTENLVPYTNATKNLNLGVFNFQTLGSITAKQHVFPTFPSTIMTSPTTSSIFYADAWEFNNTIQISSLGGGAFLSTSYLRLADGSNNSTLLTLQSDGIADFADTKVRVSTMATNAYDVVNLSTLTSAVAFIENVNALNYVPYTGALQNLNMGGSTITTLGQINAGALRITSSVINADYTLSVNSSDQLEFANLSNGSVFKTNGSDLFVTGSVNCATLGATNVEAGSNIYLAKGSVAEWRTTLGMSDEYEILDDAGVMRSRLSKSTGLTVSSLTISQVPSATPTLALGVDGSNSVVSFSVPTATNILPLANTFTNTNTFLSTLTTGVGYTTSINGALSTTLNDLGFTSASFTTAGITGAYTPPLGTITNPSGSTYQITQTAQGRSIMAISGFTPSVGITYVFSFNIKCTIGTATISVEQDNILVSPALYQLTTGFNRVVGSFTYNGTPNTVVFKVYTGVASWNAQWDSFTLSTYSIGMNANMNALTVSNRFTQRYNALAGDVSTLVNRATMDSAISAAATPNLLPLNNTWSGTNTFNNTVQVSGVGVNLGVSLGSIIKTTATAGSLVQITGGGAGNSPYLEFLFGGNSRGYIGNASAVDLDLVAQNGAKLNFYTAGAKRLEIDTAGDVRMYGKVNINSSSGDYTNSVIINTPWPSITLDGTGTSNKRWSILNGGIGAGIGQGNFGIFDITNGRYGFNIDQLGNVGINQQLPTYKLHVGGANGNIRAEGSVYCDRYLGTNSALRIDLDAGQTVNWITNNSGTKPISYGPGTWANNGYTVISQSQGVNSPGLGLGNSSYPGFNGGRSVIIGLNPGIQWGELIISAGTIYTAASGTVNLYTNGGGWVFVSDKRYKKDIKDIKTTRSLERIMALKPKTYKKIYPENSEAPISQKTLDAVHIGFLAQDVMETNPHCIDEWVDDNAVCDGDDGKRLGISYGDINIHMVGAIQEIVKQSTSQATLVQELKKQNDKQQEQIENLGAYKNLSEERFEKMGRLIADQQKLLEFLMAKLK